MGGLEWSGDLGCFHGPLTDYSVFSPMRSGLFTREPTLSDHFLFLDFYPNQMEKEFYLCLKTGYLLKWVMALS